MIVLIVRTLILYAIVITSLRIMGKRQIGELQPSELVVAIMISDLASVPMQAIDTPLLAGAVPVITLVVAEIVMSYLTLKSRKIRKFVTGEPSIIIYDGHVNENEMERLRFNINDLLEELRVSGYPNIADVEVAVLETNGQMSIIPKTYARTVTIEDMNIKNPNRDGLAYMLISDGRLNKNELRRSGKSEKWVTDKLKEHNIDTVSKVFIASLDMQDNLHIQPKGEKDKK